MLYLSGNYGELAAEPRRALPRVIPTTFLNVMFVVLGRSWDSSVVSLSHSLLLSIVAILYSYQSPALLNGEPKLLHFPLIWWMTFGMRWWLEGAMRGKFTLSKPRFPWWSKDAVLRTSTAGSLFEKEKNTVCLSVYNLTAQYKQIVLQKRKLAEWGLLSPSITAAWMNTKGRLCWNS